MSRGAPPPYVTHRSLRGRRTPAEPVRVDNLLSQWRASRPGSWIAFGSYGVRLCAGIGHEVMTFRDSEAALEFVTRP